MPYSGSPQTGWPIACRWTLIWCVRPVSSSRLSSDVDASARSSVKWVRASRRPRSADGHPACGFAGRARSAPRSSPYAPAGGPRRGPGIPARSPAGPAAPGAGAAPARSRATTIRPEVSLSRRWTIPGARGPGPPRRPRAAGEQLREGALAVARARGARPGRGPCPGRSGTRPGGRSSPALAGAHGSLRRAWSITRNSPTIPRVIEASARLNGGQPSGSLMKSVTEPWRTCRGCCRSPRPGASPSAARSEPPSHAGRNSPRAAHSATPIRIVTPMWLPGRKPNATPWLRVLTTPRPAANAVLRRGRSSCGQRAWPAGPARRRRPSRRRAAMAQANPGGGERIFARPIGLSRGSGAWTMTG